MSSGEQSRTASPSRDQDGAVIESLMVPNAERSITQHRPDPTTGDIAASIEIQHDNSASSTKSNSTGTRKKEKIISFEVPSRRITRATTPSAELSTELTLRMQGQINKMKLINELHASMPPSSDQTNIEELEAISNEADTLINNIHTEDTYFQLNWPATHLTHDYFSRDFHLEAQRLHSLLKRTVARLKGEIITREQQSERRPSTSSVDLIMDTRQNTQLPHIPLPNYVGDYASWPAFRDLFTSLVIDNNSLAPINRLHYLKSCISGEPLKLISGLPMIGASFYAAWGQLCDRYENKRLIISSYLDRLFGSTAQIPAKAESLNELITNVNECLSSLSSLDFSATMWDCILVYHLTRRLDTHTREAWETSLGATVDYPKIDQLLSFLNTRARARERIEASRPPQLTTSSSKPQAAKRAGYQASTSTTSANQLQKSPPHPCDCCNGTHFIISCPKFRDMVIAQREHVAIQRRLCFNCLGRHSSSNCQSQGSCKQCQRHHHTMLHGFSGKNTQVTTVPIDGIEPRPFTARRGQESSAQSSTSSSSITPASSSSTNNQ